MSISRKLVLSVSGNRLVKSFAMKYGMKLGAARFVAGESLNASLDMVHSLNRENLVVTLDHLGESVENREEATTATNAVLEIFDAIKRERLHSNVSVKLTQLGLALDPAFCLDNMDRIVAKAKETSNFVRIDMEDTPFLEQTMNIFLTLLERYGKEHVGLVIQSYLYRSIEDVEALGKKGVNLRIVKGAYKEPPEVAYPQKKDVDENYLRLVQTHLQNGCYTGIATHDEKIIEELKIWLAQEKISQDLFEFQMLYGVRNGLQRNLVKEGYRVRVYTPFGTDWYPYFTRRIAERPANALFILKNMFRD
ncbi:proline dehydrogenase family protein [Risungbinella massiliensis]|uniref:proline dehydrogenase family protein n=1 Tax=Risungbinella massiliensis TaxID=1329796 RepID=UPI00069B5B06|nr:proline dehydrogenase family protein [Risungbinella massiliensis]